MEDNPDPDQLGTEELHKLRIRSQHDLHRMWELLMRPLGFGSRSLWVSLIGDDDRPTRFVLEIAETDEVPDDLAA